MMKARRAAGILMLLVSQALLLWGIWPQATKVRTVPLSPNPFTPSVTSNIPYLFENNLLVLEWPPRLRAGDSGLLQLKIIEDQQGYPPPTIGTDEDAPTIETYKSPDSNTAGKAIVEAHLDILGLQYTPTGENREAYHQGQPVMFLWRVRTPVANIYRGTIWLHVLTNSQDGSKETRNILSAPRVEIEGISFLGLGGTAARVLGSVGVVVGSFLGLDGLFYWLWDYFSTIKKSGSTG
jgi:hypothetical protein